MIIVTSEHVAGYKVTETKGRFSVWWCAAAASAAT
jgi:uncharacterized protein YbjQ (UPF0145 family)